MSVQESGTVAKMHPSSAAYLRTAAAATWAKNYCPAIKKKGFTWMFGHLLRHTITNLGGILVKQYKCIGILRDFPYDSALFGLVSYNALGHVFVSNLDMKHLIMTADACLKAK